IYARSAGCEPEYIMTSEMLDHLAQLGSTANLLQRLEPRAALRIKRDVAGSVRVGTPDLQHTAVPEGLDDVAQGSLYAFARKVPQVQQVHAAHEAECAWHACQENVIVDP